ncbi:hypothetical protein DFP72DRAFT_323214 [Ephemerocybe angulata]|uniref:Uncharacterized protein n=1 Tax=Ephemerocybe angulata TaxID=980116 RepID=A0A8H6MH71_9AGAR|nr:hypothetical protein DFP72DRAFT_323214 [Tulosesus angulatus]
MATALSRPRSLPQHPWQHATTAPKNSSPHGHSPSSSSTNSLSSSSTPTNTASLRLSPPPSALPLSARKIRFAPLPDPRRSVLITDDGEELPIPNGDNENQISSCPPSPAVYAVDAPNQDISSLSSLASSSKRHSDSTEPSASGSTTPASMTNTTNSEASGSEPASPASIPICLPPPLPAVKAPSAPVAPPPTSGWPKSKGLSFFRSLKPRSSRSSSSGSSHTLTPTSSIDPNKDSRKGITTEEILTLGTINLFRTSSRESTGDGWNLTRWSSASSAGPSSNNGPARNFGVPLTRTQSTQSYKSKTPSLLSGLRYSTATTPKPAKQKQKQAPNRKGTRMLNGRVYGGKRDPNANPFANARDEEPKFVEWGYGGMGSVKGATSAGVTGAGWEKLGGQPDDDLEDSTGMAWIKKRREAREQKAREEQEAKEKAEKEALESSVTETEDVEKASSEANGVDEVAQVDVPATLSAASTLATITESAQPTPTASTADITAPSLAPKLSSLSITSREAPSLPSTPSIPATSPSRDIPSPLSSSNTSEDGHVFETMAIPMSRPHHHRSRSASTATFPHVVELDTVGPNVELAKLESESESDSETSSESDREESDDEDEEDEEEEERRRKMVIGAGMEKVSRHRAEVEEA